MDTGLDFFNAWMKTQKDFLATSLKSQETFRANWLDAMKKTQESFLTTANAYDSPQSREAIKFFNTWFSGVINSSEVFNDQVLKIQQTWEKALDMQIEQTRELATGFAEFLKQTEAKAEKQ